MSPQRGCVRDTVHELAINYKVVTKARWQRVSDASWYDTAVLEFPSTGPDK